MYHNERLLAASKSKPTLNKCLSQHALHSTHHKDKSADVNDDSEPGSKLAGPATFFSTNLPLDIYSAEAIPPIHPCLPYYLSFYHLSCAQRNLLDTNTTAFIEELSCHGTSSPSDQWAQCQWRSEVYFENEKFFQYQTIIFDVTRQRPLSSSSFTFCHHCKISFPPILFYNHNGFDHAEFRRPFKYRATPGDDYSPMVEGWWDTIDGSYLHPWCCPHCLTEGNVSIFLEGDALRLHLQVFRALGSGWGRPTNPAHSVWTALLTGTGSPRRMAYKLPFDLKDAVEQVAKKLKRPIPSFVKPSESEYFA